MEPSEMLFLLSQGLGLAAAVLVLGAAIARGRATLPWLAGASLAYALHLAALGEWAGVAVNLVTCARMLAATAWPGSVPVALASSAAAAGLTGLLWQGPTDLLVLGSALGGTVAAVFLGQRWVKPGLAASYLLSMAYAVAVASPAAVLVISVLLGGLAAGGMRDRVLPGPSLLARGAARSNPHRTAPEAGTP